MGCRKPVLPIERQMLAQMPSPDRGTFVGTIHARHVKLFHGCTNPPDERDLAFLLIGEAFAPLARVNKDCVDAIKRVHDQPSIDAVRDKLVFVLHNIGQKECHSAQG